MSDDSTTERSPSRTEGKDRRRRHSNRPLGLSADVALGWEARRVVPLLLAVAVGQVWVRYLRLRFGFTEFFFDAEKYWLPIAKLLSEGAVLYTDGVTDNKTPLWHALNYAVYLTDHYALVFLTLVGVANALTASLLWWWCRDAGYSKGGAIAAVSYLATMPAHQRPHHQRSVVQPVLSHARCADEDARQAGHLHRNRGAVQPIHRIRHSSTPRGRVPSERNARQVGRKISHRGGDCGNERVRADGLGLLPSHRPRRVRGEFSLRRAVHYPARGQSESVPVSGRVAGETRRDCP